MTAWATWKALPLRIKVAVVIAAPLWLPDSSFASSHAVSAT